MDVWASSPHFHNPLHTSGNRLHRAADTKDCKSTSQENNHNKDIIVKREAVFLQGGHIIHIHAFTVFWGTSLLSLFKNNRVTNTNKTSCYLVKAFSATWQPYDDETEEYLLQFSEKESEQQENEELSRWAHIH